MIIEFVIIIILAGLDVFEVESVIPNPTTHRIALRGSSATALGILNSSTIIMIIEITLKRLLSVILQSHILGSALNWYLKYPCHCTVSWLGDNLNIPYPPPMVKPKVSIK